MARFGTRFVVFSRGERVPMLLDASGCCCRPKTDHLCRLKIDQGWKPGAAAPGVV